MNGVVIVTGGSRGIGAATARMAAARGYAVCVNYRGNAMAAGAVVADITAAGGRAVAVRADIGVAAEVEALFDQAERQLGKVTALVNNAGVAGLASRLDASDPELISEILRINVLGSILCARMAVKRMSRKLGGTGGAIVNLSSIAATMGSPNEYVWYAASKGAIDTLTLGLSREVAGDGIRVNAVAPGLIETDIHAASGMPDRLETMAPTLPMQRAGTPEEVAEAILWLLSEAASYVTGTVLKVNGGR